MDVRSPSRYVVAHTGHGKEAHHPGRILRSIFQAKLSVKVLITCVHYRFCSDSFFTYSFCCRQRISGTTFFLKRKTPFPILPRKGVLKSLSISELQRRLVVATSPEWRAHIADHAHHHWCVHWTKLYVDDRVHFLYFFLTLFFLIPTSCHQFCGRDWRQGYGLTRNLQERKGSFFVTRLTSREHREVEHSDHWPSAYFYLPYTPTTSYFD